MEVGVEVVTMVVEAQLVLVEVEVPVTPCTLSSAQQGLTLAMDTQQ